MNPLHALALHLNRRTFLSRSALGLAAFGSLLEAQAPAVSAVKGSPGVINPSHHPARARRVIWLTMAGGPSHLETLDYKPKLAEMHGKPMPESLTKGQQIAQLQGQKLVCFGPQTKFARFGKCGAEICALFPQPGLRGR